MLDIFKSEIVSQTQNIKRVSIFFLLLLSLCGCSDYAKPVGPEPRKIDLQTSDPNAAQQMDQDGEVPSLNVWYFEEDRILGFESEEMFHNFEKLLSSNKSFKESKVKEGSRVFKDVPVGPAKNTLMFYASYDLDKTFQERIWAPWKYEGEDLLVLGQFPVKVAWVCENTGDSGLGYSFDSKKGVCQQVYCFIYEVKVDLWKTTFTSDNDEMTCTAWYAVQADRPVQGYTRSAQITPTAPSMK